MLHCNNCKIDIADNLQKCPVCEKKLKNNLKKQQFVCYPDNRAWIDKRNNVLKSLAYILTFFSFLCIIVDIIVNKHLSFSFYVLASYVIVMLDIIFPLKKYWSFSSTSTVVGISLSCYVLLVEWFTNSFGWGLNYVVPLFLMFMSIYSSSIIFSRNYYKGFEFALPLIIFNVLALVLFVVSLLLNVILWPSLMCFLTSIILLICVLIFRTKKVRQELEKSFFV